MRSRAPESVIFSRNVPIGCGLASESAQARSFSFMRNAAASRTGTVVRRAPARRG